MNNSSGHRRQFLTIIGGTGTIGGTVAEAALARNLSVRIVARNPPVHPLSPPSSSGMGKCGTEKEKENEECLVVYEQMDIVKCLASPPLTPCDQQTKADEEEVVVVQHAEQNTNSADMATIECTSDTSSSAVQSTNQKDVSSGDNEEIHRLRQWIWSSFAVVNTLSDWTSPPAQLERVHVTTAGRLAQLISEENTSATATATAPSVGCCRYILMSGLGSDAESPNPFLSCRGRGDEAALYFGPQQGGTFVVRPGAIIDPSDATRCLVPKFIDLARMRFCPLFGDGNQYLQPIALGDLARLTVGLASSSSSITLTQHRHDSTCSAEKQTNDAVGMDVSMPSTSAAEAAVQCEAQGNGTPFNLGVTNAIVNAVGPDRITSRGVLQRVAEGLGIGRWYFPVPTPFPVWDAIAKACEALSLPLLSTAQVLLMRDPLAITHNPAVTSHRFTVPMPPRPSSSPQQSVLSSSETKNKESSSLLSNTATNEKERTVCSSDGRQSSRRSSSAIDSRQDDNEAHVHTVPVVSAMVLLPDLGSGIDSITPSVAAVVEKGLSRRKWGAGGPGRR